MGETKMIETKKSYVIEFSEDQARQLYILLKYAKDIGDDCRYDELRPLYNELKELFDTGIR